MILLEIEGARAPMPHSCNRRTDGQTFCYQNAALHYVADLKQTAHNSTH